MSMFQQDITPNTRLFLEVPLSFIVVVVALSKASTGKAGNSETASLLRPDTKDIAIRVNDVPGYAQAVGKLSSVTVQSVL
jgi:hypothetical protein